MFTPISTRAGKSERPQLHTPQRRFKGHRTILMPLESTRASCLSPPTPPRLIDEPSTKSISKDFLDSDDDAHSEDPAVLCADPYSMMMSSFEGFEP